MLSHKAESREFFERTAFFEAARCSTDSGRKVVERNRPLTLRACQRFKTLRIALKLALVQCLRPAKLSPKCQAFENMTAIRCLILDQYSGPCGPWSRMISSTRSYRGGSSIPNVSTE